MSQTLIRRRYLMDKPQRWGILPTAWFWEEVGRSSLKFRILVTAVLMLPVGLIWYWSVASAAPLWLALPLVLIVPPLLWGGLERMLRRVVRARSRDEANALPAAWSELALGPAPGSPQEWTEEPPPTSTVARRRSSGAPLDTPN